MTSKLGQILDLIEADVLLSIPDVKFERGTKHLNTLTAPSIVVWVHRRDSFAPGRQFSALERSRRTALTTVEAHCRGAQDALETIEFQLVLSALKIAQGSVDFGDADWILPDSGGRDVEYCVLPMTFSIPVTEPVATTAVIDSVESDSSDAVAGDGVLECGEL